MTQKNPTITARIRHWTRIKTENLSDSFNILSTAKKRMLMIMLGIFMASACSFILIQSILLQPVPSIDTVPITQPKDTRMSSPYQPLIPLGKMKGEMEGQYKSFHVAVDKDGQLFINPDPEFSKDSLYKENGWEPITRKQLDKYEEQLHFIPTHKKTMKR